MTTRSMIESADEPGYVTLAREQHTVRRRVQLLWLSAAVLVLIVGHLCCRQDSADAWSIDSRAAVAISRHAPLCGTAHGFALPDKCRRAVQTAGTER